MTNFGTVYRSLYTENRKYLKVMLDLRLKKKSNYKDQLYQPSFVLAEYRKKALYYPYNSHLYRNIILKYHEY